MRDPVRVTAALLAGCALALAGCTADPPEPPAPAPIEPDDGQAAAEEPVRDYLDAMRAKDVEQGRAQLCPATQEIFDTSATGPGGDFAERFTVPAAQVVDTRAVTVGFEVTAAVTVAVADATTDVELVFTVTPTGEDGWCIHDETGSSPAADSTVQPADDSASVPAD